MKKITQKILAGILTLAMVLGCFGGMGTLEVKAAGTITIESITAQSSTVSKNGGDVSFFFFGTSPLTILSASPSAIAVFPNSWFSN